MSLHVHCREARHLADLLLAGDPDTLIEDLAHAALEAMEERDGARQVLRLALAAIFDLNAKLDRARETIARLHDQRRKAA